MRHAFRHISRVSSLQTPLQLTTPIRVHEQSELPPCATHRAIRVLHTAPRLVTTNSLWAKPSHPGILQVRASGGQRHTSCCSRGSGSGAANV